MSTPVTVRRLRTKDLDRIERIEQATFGPDAYERNLFAEFLDKCGELFLVAECGPTVCGYVITCTRGVDRRGIQTAELVSIAVDPASRGRGVGSALLDSTLRRLRRRAVDRLILMVRVTNEPARAFYEKYGFRRVRLVRRYYEDGGDGLLMVRYLRAES